MRSHVRAGCYTGPVPRISPFIGWVFDPAVVGSLGSVTAPPYDVIGDAAERAYREASPYNVVRLDLAKRDEDGGYERAGALLESWRRTGALISVPEGGFAYEMRFRMQGEARRIRGLICAMELEDWGGTVLPHERTMPGPVEDRLQLLRATRANLSPIYGAIAGPCPRLAAVLDEVTGEPAPWIATDDEGIEHRMWRVEVPPDLVGPLAEEPLLIADGHHRYTTALAYRDERRATDGAGPWDRVLTLVVDAGSEDLRVLPYHRVVLRGPVPVAGWRVSDLDELLAGLRDDGLRYGTVALQDGTLVHRLAELAGPPPTVSALHDHVLGSDLRPGEDVRFTPDAAAAVAAVRDGDAVAAYLLPATTPERIRDVIARGDRLPQKSTFFWPKPRTGMVIRPLDPADA
jgi:uncharacterized protein (DUF1015 family)